MSLFKDISIKMRMILLIMVCILILCGYGFFASQGLEELNDVTDEIANYADNLEVQLDDLSKMDSENSYEFVKRANKIQMAQKRILIIYLIVLSFGALIVLYFITKSISTPISKLEEAIHISTNTNEFKEADIEGNNEIADIAKNYNILIKKLSNEFWITDNQNSLTRCLSGEFDLNKYTQVTINFLSRTLDAGQGVFYIYDDKEDVLKLKSSFAFTERDRISNEYSLGEGTIGQVGLEKTPILLKNIKRQEALITTGTLEEAPLNTYTFPLLYEEELYGVIELASFEPFDKLKQRFIEEVSPLIVTNLYSILKNEKVKELLRTTEEAERIAIKKSKELKEANKKLKDQHELLHNQAKELQETNTQLEEQQQLLEQQSREVEQTNLELEEKQKLLEEQSRLLSEKNLSLEDSKKELDERTKELEMANKYKSEFLANVSHELRTPLNSIILLSNLLKDNKNGDLKEKSIEQAKVINDSGVELLRLINDILDLSKIESGNMDMDLVEFKSKDLLNELGLLFKENSAQKGLEFITEDLVNDDLIGDKNKISQILRNFLSNAFKFTEKGRIKLSLKYMEDDDTVVFSVSDTGIGIPEGKQELVFQEFKQVDGSVSRKYGGTGLGLSIAKRLATIMEGEIKVQSKEGIGSIFSLHLPKALSHKEADTYKENSKCIEEFKRAIDEVAISKDSQYNSHKKKTILIIEDDMNFANIIKGINDDMDINSLIATTGEDGLRLAKKDDIDGILLDIGLPDMNGIEVLKKLKLIERLRPIPVHIISAKLKNNRTEGLGVIGYNQKPVDENKIREVISNMLNIDETNIEKSIKLKNKEILVVDDDVRNVFVLASVFEEYGAVIHNAENGRAALEKLEKINPDLILMDIMMPIMDGYETISRIKEKNEYDSIPIIALTAKSMEEDRAKCIEAGADDYMAKPVDNDTLVRLVNAWINK